MSTQQPKPSNPSAQAPKAPQPNVKDAPNMDAHDGPFPHAASVPPSPALGPSIAKAAPKLVALPASAFKPPPVPLVPLAKPAIAPAPAPAAAKPAPAAAKPAPAPGPAPAPVAADPPRIMINRTPIPRERFFPALHDMPRKYRFRTQYNPRFYQDESDKFNIYVFVDYPDSGSPKSDFWYGGYQSHLHIIGKVISQTNPSRTFYQLERMVMTLRIGEDRLGWSEHIGIRDYGNFTREITRGLFQDSWEELEKIQVPKGAFNPGTIWAQKTFDDMEFYYIEWRNLLLDMQDTYYNWFRP